MTFQKDDRVRLYGDDLAPTFGRVIYKPQTNSHRYVIELETRGSFQKFRADDTLQRRAS
jgi:hypothetical protein